MNLVQLSTAIAAFRCSEVFNTAYLYLRSYDNQPLPLTKDADYCIDPESNQVIIPTSYSDSSDKTHCIEQQFIPAEEIVWIKLSAEKANNVS